MAKVARDKKEDVGYYSENQVQEEHIPVQRQPEQSTQDPKWLTRAEALVEIIVAEID